MERATFKTLFSDFMNLGFNVRKFNQPVNFKDFPISTLTLGRFENYELKIYYLTKGFSIIIPINWINLFTNFNEYYKELEILFEDDPVDKFAKLIIELCIYLEYLGDVSDITYSKCFQDIIDIKSFEFIKYIKQEFDVSLSPLEITNSNNTIEV